MSHRNCSESSSGKVCRNTAQPYWEEVTGVYGASVMKTPRLQLVSYLTEKPNGLPPDLYMVAVGT